MLVAKTTSPQIQSPLSPLSYSQKNVVLPFISNRDVLVWSFQVSSVAVLLSLLPWCLSRTDPVQTLHPALYPFPSEGVHSDDSSLTSLLPLPALSLSTSFNSAILAAVLNAIAMETEWQTSARTVCAFPYNFSFFLYFWTVSVLSLCLRLARDRRNPCLTL